MQKSAEIPGEHPINGTGTLLLEQNFIIIQQLYRKFQDIF